jgi:branched-chain amino acid transport system substrate-binding protein
VRSPVTAGSRGCARTPSERAQNWEMTERRAGRSAAAALAGLVLLAAACGNAASTVSTAGNNDGVTASSITVGSIASLSGPVPADFAGIVQGVQAYFDMVNASGGVYGRKIVDPYVLDDASDPSLDNLKAHQLVEQDHVFAVVGVGVYEFQAAQYLVQQDVPTFGYAVGPEWSTGDNLFGAEGSYVDFLHPGPEPAFLAQQVHAQKVALLAYSVAASHDACEGFAGVLQRYGISVVYEDISIPAPAIDLSADAIRMKSAGAQLVISCMDLSGNVLLAQALQQQAMTSVAQYWLNGYDQQTLQQYGSLMDGVYFLLPHTPFELSAQQLPRYPGMQQYLAALARYFPGDTPSEVSLAGWINAATFVAGLERIGPHVAPTRERLIAAVNSMVNWTADGLVSPITWQSEHDANGPYDCNVYVQVRAGHFVPVFGSKPSVFTCFEYPEPAGTRQLVPIAPPPAVPGS